MRDARASGQANAANETHAQIPPDAPKEGSIDGWLAKAVAVADVTADPPPTAALSAAAIWETIRG